MNISELHRGHYIQTRLNMVACSDISFTATSTIATAGSVNFNDYFTAGDTISVYVDDGVGTNNGDYTISTITTVTNPGDTITTTETTLSTQAAGEKTTISSPRTRVFADPADTFQDLDFQLNYHVDVAEGWSYSDVTKHFTYLADHPVIHRVNWDISVAADGSPAGEILEIGMRKSQDAGVTWRCLDAARSYREFEGTQVGHYGASFLYLVEPGDIFKMNARVNGDLTITVENLTINFHVNDVIS